MKSGEAPFAGFLMALTTIFLPGSPENLAVKGSIPYFAALMEEDSALERL